MTTTEMALSSATGPQRVGHFGAWRAMSTIPAIFGSAMLLLVLFGHLGKWEGVLLLGWLCSGAVVFTRVGERIAVRVGAGFRRPSKTQSALLAPAWSAALTRCGLTAGEVDLYVQRTTHPNAYAAGGRSVAVTTGVIAKFQAHRMGQEYLVALLAHELGHHATRATKFALVSTWLAAPWRRVTRFIFGIAYWLVGRRQPPRLLAGMLVAVVAIAIVQSAQQRQWAIVATLSVVAFCTVVCPLADAAVSRRCEYAADRYAAAAGLGPQLAAALQILNDGNEVPAGPLTRLLDRHPDLTRRVDALHGAQAFA